MNASIPWWGSGLFTVAGVLITTIAGLVSVIISRRTERRRLARDQKVEAYQDLLHAASRLARLAVWPVAAGDPIGLYDETDRTAQRIRLFAPEDVKNAAATVLTTMDSLVAVITTIRTESSPAHGELIDQRDLSRYNEAVEKLRHAEYDFIAAIRVDLEVDPG